MKPSEAILQYLDYNRQADAWIDTVPNEINDVFFDNPYVYQKENQLNVLLSALLPDSALYDLDLYIEYNYSLEGSNNNIPLDIDNDEDFVKMLINFYNIDSVIKFSKRH